MQKAKYYFYLNPFDEYKWTKCPNCEAKTKLRKYCLTISYNDEEKKARQLLSLNKSCKFCPDCQLIIAHKSEIDTFVARLVESLGLRFNADNCFVFGTMDRKHWKKGQQEAMSPASALEIISPFKNVWNFKVRPAGWYLASKPAGPKKK